MGGRQLTLFKAGCWMAIVTAIAHLVGQLGGPQAPANDTERTLTELATNYKFALPGAQRSLMDFMNGFSLSFALFFALLGGTGLIVAKRGCADATLMTAFVRTYAVGLLVLLVISLTYWFIAPTAFIATTALCFITAALGSKPLPAVVS
jgi:hypothetical protein